MSDIKKSGKVHKVGAEQKITDNFSKRQLVIDTGEKFAPYLPIDFTNKNMSLLDALNVGQEVTVLLNLGGRESKDGRYWPDISGWKIELGEGADPASPPAENQSDSWGDEEDDEDTTIPF